MISTSITYTDRKHDDGSYIKEDLVRRRMERSGRILVRLETEKFFEFVIKRTTLVIGERIVGRS